MSERLKKVVEQVNAAFRESSVERFLSCCAEDVEWTMVGEKTVKGKSAIREWMGSGPQSPPQFSVAQLIAEGDCVVAYGDMTMDESGQKDVPYAYCDVYRFTDEKVVELRSYVIKTQSK